MANYYGSPAPALPYGATIPSSKPRVVRPSRLNFAAMCICLFVPWTLFCCLYAVFSFSVHHTSRFACYFCAFLGLVVVLLMVKLAIDAVKKQRADPQSDPRWFVFLAIACFIAWIGGVILGDMNYFYNMEPFYDVGNLNAYSSVDPSRMPGQQVMDAGQLTFVNGSKLAPDKAMAFHNFDTYCVAPVVNSLSQGPPASYDFWAVGLNCCTGDSGSFACGESTNPLARSGLRVMHAEHHNFYRLAVKQAEAAFAIKATHPLFFYWMQDPSLEIAAYADEGSKYYLFGVFSFFALLVFLIIVAVLIFSKM